MEPSPFLPQTTIAIEKVKIAAKEAQPKVKIITKHNLLNYNLYQRHNLEILKANENIKNNIKIH